MNPETGRGCLYDQFWDSMKIGPAFPPTPNVFEAKEAFREADLFFLDPPAVADKKKELKKCRLCLPKKEANGDESRWKHWTI